MVSDSVELDHTLEDASQLSFRTLKKIARELSYCCFDLGFQTIPSRMCVESTGKNMRAGTAAGHLWYCEVGSVLRGLF